MAVMQMQKVSICALNKHRKSILEDIQKMGFMEVDESIDSDKEFSRQDTSLERSSISKDANQAEKALEIIDIYAPRDKVPFESFKGKKELEDDIYSLGAESSEELVSVANKLTDLDRDIVGLKANIVRLQNQIEELMPWMDLDVPMDCDGTKETAFIVGTVPEDISERDLEERVITQSPDLEGFAVYKISGSQDMSYFAVLILKNIEKEVEETLRHVGFSRPSVLLNEIPKIAKENMEKEIDENQKDIESLTEEISSLANNYDRLKMYSDYSRIRATKYEVLGSLPQTRNAFAIEGFVPKDYVDALSSSLEKYDAIIEIRDLNEDEEAPVLFKNSWFGSIGEGTVASFGLPNKKEIDPSSIMMVFYVIFFGLMLSDAAYGLVLSLGTGIMLLKFPKMEQGMKKLMELFFLCGFSTLFWGVMFGGYFGDVVDIVAKTFLGVQLAEGETIIPALWFTPLNNPMRMLIYSLLFGVIHMFVGLFLGAYQNIKNKDYMGFFVDNLCAGMFILGLILILLPTDLFGSIAQMDFNFPPVVGLLSKVMTIVGFLGITLFSGRDSKNPGVRIALGLYDIYNNVTGWLSDTLSYSRLLALGLATGVIASVINQMGSMLGKGIVGVILFIIVFIGGHIFNLAINVLGAYVHTCRLQYVEFFGKFYEGGGRKFEPFLADTKYVEIKGGK